VDGIYRKGGEADGDVFGSVCVRSGVADPLAGVGDDGLSGSNLEGTVFVFDAKGAFENHGELVEGGRLSGLEPPGGAAHVGDAGGGGLGVDASYVLVDEFGLVAGGLDARGFGDQSRHGWSQFNPKVRV
jgi:hypothetical protein